MTEKNNLKKTIGLPLKVSAGGLVCNDDHHILLIYKRGKWDMPKGRIEEDGIPASALREVSEETGLSLDRLKIEGKLPSSWHTTMHDGVRYLKKTHWFMMNYDGHDDDVSPQYEEGIIECRWIHLSDLPEYLGLMRARIHYVIDFWHKNLAYPFKK